MAQVARATEVALVSKVPLLMTESGEEFASLCASLAREIKPHGIIERTYLDDFATILWEIQRLRRCKAVIINTAFRTALESLLGQLMRASGLVSDELFNGKAKALALAWFRIRRAGTRSQKSSVSFISMILPLKPRRSEFPPLIWNLWIGC